MTCARSRMHGASRDHSARIARAIRSRVGLLTCLALIPAAASAQEYDERYPDPFPGGYPAMGDRGGAGKMYMESYYMPVVTATPAYPTWSPDGQSLAFSYQGRLWTVPVEGGTARQLTTGPGYHSQPSFSPDGRYVAYTADVDLNLDIYILDRQTGEMHRATKDPHIDVRPRWSPDGLRILFTTARDSTFDIWAYDVERGIAEPVISDSAQHDMDADWIGDRGDLVFVSERGEAALGSGSLWRWIAAEQRAELLLRVETNYQAAPVVAPNGGAVAYITDETGNNELHLSPSRKAERGIQPVRVTITQADEYFPAWSPDSERVVYVRNGGAVAEDPTFAYARAGGISDEERTIDQGMGFSLHTVGRGGGEPQPVRIDRYEWTEPSGTIEVRVNDTNGELLPARIYLRAADGQSYFPHGSYPRVQSGPEDYYFHTDGNFSVTLPVGEAQLEVWRGFEYEPVYRPVNVRRGESTAIEVELARSIDMAVEGWHSGDNHIHPNYGGHYRVTPEDLLHKAQAEDLNVANGMIANYWGNSRIEDLEHFQGHPHDFAGHSHGEAEERTIVYYNEEYRPSFFGHLSLLNLIELITPFFIGSSGTAWHAHYPDNATVLRKVHGQGGIGGYVHPFGLSHRKPELAGFTSGSRELPVDAALGVADFVDLACIWSDELGTAEVWYRLLNTGSRIAATAGTDAMTDIWRHPAVGTTRSYVYTGSSELDYDEWAEAMKQGRAFVTSGPIITLDVSGQGMGGELRVSKGESVDVSVTARSIFVMDRLEIIQNGRVIHTLEATGDRKELEATLRVPIESSGWIAARVLGPPQHGVMDSYLFAHTNPVFIIADGEPIRSSEDAAYFVQWIDANIERLKAMDSYDDPAQLDEVFATFERGRALYQAQVDEGDGNQD